MNEFYWLIPGVLAGSRRPGGRSGRDQLDAELRWLRAQGIGAILTLTEDPLSPLEANAHGFELLHLPVIDFTPPMPEQLALALAFIDRQRSADRPVLVHCLAGQGRTGTVLAAYLIRAGNSPDRAISMVRQVCPLAVENDRQRAALREFAAECAWLA